MMFARALSRAARAFASDVVGGMYETGELADISPDTEYIAIEGKGGEIYYTDPDTGEIHSDVEAIVEEKPSESRTDNKSKKEKN